MNTSIARRRILVSAFLAACSIVAMAAVPYTEGFENPGFVAPPIAAGPGWFSYQSEMNRVASGTAGIPSKGGAYHAAVTPPVGPGFSGVFSRLGGYSPNFGGGYVVSVDAYMDLSDPSVLANTYGWDLSTASNNQANAHRRDFIFHTASNASGQILVGGSNNTNFARRNDLGSINHYTINASGWYRFEWVFRENAGVLAVDLNLRDGANNLLWTETRQDNSDLIASIIGGNRYMWFTFLDTNYLAVDNAQVRGLDAGGLPVDLNGTYVAPASLPYNPMFPVLPDALGSATTNPAGDRMAGGQVSARSQGAAGAESTFTPFSDALKAPKSLTGLDMRGESFTADVDVHDVSLWAEYGEFFQLGLGRQAVPEDDTEESYVFMYRDPAGFKIYLATDWSEFGIPPGNEFTAAPGETQFRVRVDYDATGTTAQLSVTPLNGPNAGVTTVTLPLNLDGPNDNVTNASFFAGFTMNSWEQASAKCTVSNFRTSAGSNWLHVFANDPYNKSTEQVNYEVGMAGLAQPVGGFQAYLQSISLSGALNFVNGNYTTSPFPAGHFYGAAPDNTGRISGGISGAAPLVTLNAILANLSFAGAHGTRGSVAINPNDGGQLNTQFSDDLGTAFIANRQGSNIAMVDDVAPVLSGLTAMQGMDNILVAPGAQTGPLEISINAVDAFTGLATQPSVTIDFAPLGAGPEDVALPAFSSVGNLFKAYYTIPANAPNGPAQILLSGVDRAGNVANLASTTFNVNTATVTLNIQLQGFAAAGPVIRGVDIHFGGAGGANAPLVLSRDVTFSASGLGTVTFDSGDGLPSAAGAYSISVKEPLHTLRSTVALTSVGNQHSGSVTLRGGNLNLDNKIDISDYVVYAVKYGIPVSPNTPFPHAPTFRHADISGDGVVDSVDFTFISIGFGVQFDDAMVGFYGRSDRTIRRRITVEDAIREAGGDRTVRLLDLNRDGVITIEEIQQYLRRRG